MSTKQASRYTGKLWSAPPYAMDQGHREFEDTTPPVKEKIPFSKILLHAHFNTILKPATYTIMDVFTMIGGQFANVIDCYPSVSHVETGQQRLIAIPGR